MAGARERIRRVARPLGLEPALVRAKRALDSREVKRNRRDDENLRLLMAATLDPGASGIDVGANVGDVLAALVEVAPAGRHVAFEPVPALAAALRRRFPRVDVRDVALSDREGDVEFAVVRDQPSRSGLRAPAGSSGGVDLVSVRMRRLDDALPDGLEPRFLKIDVEGAERQVLEGAAETIRAHRPVIALEFDPAWAARYGTRAADLHALLDAEMGYAIRDMDGRGPFDERAFLAVTAPGPGRRWNFFARPR